MKSENKLSILLLFFALVQIVLVLLLGQGRQVSDSQYYMDIADRAIAQHAWYPAVSDIHSFHIWAPGFINLLILTKKIFGSYLPVTLYANILFNCILLFEISGIAGKLFGRKAGWAAAVLYCLYAGNYGIILYVFTELVFCCCAYGSLWLVVEYIDREKILPLPFVAAGLLMGAAQTVRPMAAPFLFAVFLYAVLSRRLLQKAMLAYALSFFITVAAAGAVSYYRIGYFVSSSTTGGLNLLIGSNDDANGTWTGEVFKKGKIGYLKDWEKLDFRELDKYRMHAAFEWIRRHPYRYAALLPKKFYYLYGFDEYYLPAIAGDRTAASLPPRGSFHGIAYTAIFYYSRISYFALLAAGVFGIGYAFRNRSAGGYAVSALLLTGTSMTLMVAYGMDRYKYPFMMAVMLLIAGLFREKDRPQKYENEKMA